MSDYSYLQHGNKVNIIASKHFVDKLNELIFELFFALKPRGMEVKSKWSAISTQMAVDVVAKHASELLTSGNVGARVDHVATRQRFVESWVIATIKLVDDHLPDRMAAASTILGVTNTLVGHTEVERVRPDGDAAKRCRNGRIVNKELVSHHVELLVSTNAKVRSANSNNRAIGDIGETFNDQAVAGHLSEPVVIGTISPVFSVVFAGY